LAQESTQPKAKSASNLTASATTSTNLPPVPPALSPVNPPAEPVAGKSPAETGPGMTLFTGSFGESSNAPPSSTTETPDTKIATPDLPATRSSGGGSDAIPGTSGGGSGR
jgi:hypothetical protein